MRVNPNQYVLPRYCEGDIYGFTVLTSDNPDDIDDRMEIPPQWTGGFTPRYSNGQAGSLVALGAIGKAPPFNLPNLRWPSEAADYQPAPDEFGDLNKSQRCKRPTFFRYQYYDKNRQEVKQSNKCTFASAFHECWYIDIHGKLKILGTSYDAKPAIFRMFSPSSGGPQIRNGCDHRIAELWQANPDGEGYNPDINLVHIAAAADETVITLDQNGSIRIVTAGASDAQLESMSNSEDWKVVYWDKEDLEHNFWIDEDGNNVVIQNKDFVDCWASGGGTTAQGITVWALHKSGKVYGQHLHTMVWNNKEYVHLDREGNPVGTFQVGGQPAIGRYEQEPYMIETKDEEGVPSGQMIQNIYHGALKDGNNPNDFVLDQNGYVRGYMVLHGSVGIFDGRWGTHGDGLSLWFDIEEQWESDLWHNRIWPRWNNEIVKHELRQIPKNSSGQRYKVLSLYDGYGHAGGCLCVDPTVEVPGETINQAPEFVLFGSWSGNIHQHMYRHLHVIKPLKAVKVEGTDEYEYVPNTEGLYRFDQELYDLLFKDTETQSYAPPIRFASSRRNFTLLTNTGMAVSIQGRNSAGDGRHLTGGNNVAPLINYRLNSDNEIEPILDQNGGSTPETGNINPDYLWEGNWFFNDDRSDVLWNGAVFASPLSWFANELPGQGGGPDSGPHRIGSGDDPQSDGRFGFGHMPRKADGTYPGIHQEPWSEYPIGGSHILYNFWYFPYIEYLGYTHETDYFNMDSLIVLRSYADEQGRTIQSHPDEFQTGTSGICVFHIGEGSPYPPFNENPVVWWAGQGDNINAVFKNGVIDSCTYFEAELSSFVWPPVSEPLQLLEDEPEPHPHPEDPEPHPEDPDDRGEGDGSFAIAWDTPSQLPDGNEKGSYQTQITATYTPAGGGGEGGGEDEGEDGGGEGGGGPIEVDSYEILDGVFPPGVEFNPATGQIIGVIPELDSFIPEFQNPPDDLETIPAPFIEAGEIAGYAQFGSQTFFSGGNTTPYPMRFTVGAMVAGKVQSQQEFVINIINNWNSDRDYFISAVFGPEYLQKLKNDYWGG